MLILLLLLSDLGNARVIIEAVLLIETITPHIDIIFIYSTSFWSFYRYIYMFKAAVLLIFNLKSHITFVKYLIGCFSQFFNKY